MVIYIDQWWENKIKDPKWFKGLPYKQHLHIRSIVSAMFQASRRDL